MGKKLTGEFLTKANDAAKRMNDQGFSQAEIQEFMDGYIQRFGTEEVKKKVESSPQLNSSPRVTEKKPESSESKSHGAWTDVENAFRTAKSQKEAQSKDIQDGYELNAVSEEIFET